MNDELILENYLLIIKSTMEVYVHGTLESSNKDVRDVLNKALNCTLKHQEDVYNELTKCGCYQVNNVKASLIKDTLNKLK